MNVPVIKIQIRSNFDGRPDIKVSGLSRRMINKDSGIKRLKNLKNTKFSVPSSSRKSIKEPETTVKNLGDRKIFTVKLPGAAKENVEVVELEESIEIRAVVGDTFYFKVIPISPNYKLKKKFVGNTLKLEVRD